MSRAVKTLTDEETKQLLDYIRHDKTGYASARSRARNYLMCVLMLDAGVRVGELVQLTTTDLIIKNKPVTTLRIRAEITKTNSDRWIPVSARLNHAIELAQQLYYLTFQTNPLRAAFISTIIDKVLTVRQVQRIIGSAGENALHRKVHPHMLRHTFASRLMRVTNSRVVQELLGHKNLSSTQIYTHPNNTDLSNAINSLD